MAALAAAAQTFASLKAGLDVRGAGRVIASDGTAFPSGFSELDRALSGGFIRGSIATLEGPVTSGRMALLARVLAGVTRTGFAAIIHDGTLYPPDLARAGVALERVLLVVAGGPIATARCADVLLRSRAFSVVAMPAVPVRAIVWSRLAGLTQKTNALTFALGAHANNELGYFASTRLRCAIERVLWTSGRGLERELAGYDICAHVTKHRRGAPGAVARLRIA